MANRLLPTSWRVHSERAALRPDGSRGVSRRETHSPYVPVMNTGRWPSWSTPEHVQAMDSVSDLAGPNSAVQYLHLVAAVGMVSRHLGHDRVSGGGGLLMNTFVMR